MTTKRQQKTSLKLLQDYKNINLDNLQIDDIKKYFKAKQIKSIIEAGKDIQNRLNVLNICPTNTILYDIYNNFAKFNANNTYHRPAPSLIPISVIISIVSYYSCVKNIKISNNNQEDFLSLWLIMLAEQSSNKTLFSNRTLKPIKDDMLRMLKLVSGAGLISSFQQAEKETNTTIYQYIDEIGDYWKELLNISNTNFQEIKEAELIAYSNDTIARETKKDKIKINNPKLVKYNFGTGYKFNKYISIDSFYDGYLRRHIILNLNSNETDEERLERIKKENVNVWNTFEYNIEQLYSGYDDKIIKLVNDIKNLEQDTKYILTEEKKEFINNLLHGLMPEIKAKYIAFYHTLLFVVYKLSAIYQIIININEKEISFDSCRYAVHWIIYCIDGLKTLFNNIESEIDYNDLWQTINVYYDKMESKKENITVNSLSRELTRNKGKLFNDLDKTKELVKLFLEQSSIDKKRLDDEIDIFEPKINYNEPF